MNVLPADNISARAKQMTCSSSVTQGLKLHSTQARSESWRGFKTTSAGLEESKKRGEQLALHPCKLMPIIPEECDGMRIHLLLECAAAENASTNVQ